MLCGADDQAADDVNNQNQNASDGVAAHKLRCTVHRTVKVGFLSELVTALLGGVLIDDAGIEVRINRHLLARHSIQSEARDDLGNPARPFCHYDEVDDHEDQENDETNNVVAGDHKLTERFNDLARRVGAGMSFNKHDPG